MTTGLLNMLDTEAELYAVFAHEAGHVRLNHMHKSASRGAGLSILSLIHISPLNALFGKVFPRLQTEPYRHLQRIL